MEIEESEFFPPPAHLTGLPRMLQSTIDEVRSAKEQSRFLVSLSRQLLRRNDGRFGDDSNLVRETTAKTQAATFRLPK